jgi:3-oxoadipate enol-lactonase
MTGKHDVVTPPIDGYFLKEQIAGARFVELEGAHLACVEDEARFNRAVLEFVTTAG